MFHMILVFALTKCTFVLESFSNVQTLSQQFHIRSDFEDHCLKTRHLCFVHSS